MAKPLPGLKDLEPMALAMAKKRARFPTDADDLFQEAMLAACKAIRREVTADHPWRLAKTIMQRAMARYYKRQDRHAPEGHSIDLTPLTAHVSVEQQDLLLDLEFFDALEVECGFRARQVAENLVAVRHARCIREVQKDGGRVTQRAVRDGLRVPVSDWRATLKEVRSFTKHWLQS